MRSSRHTVKLVGPFAVPPEWEVQALPQALRDAERALKLIEELRRTGIGGNHPLEEIDALPAAKEIVEQATLAGDTSLTV